MRWLLVLLLVAIPRLAFAEPKVALAPLDDDDGKIAEIVGEAVSENAKLTKPARVEGAMKSMGVSVLSSKSLKKLRAKLDVDVVIYGSVERSGSTKRVSLQFAGSSKAKPLEIEASTPKQLRKDLATKLAKRIDAAMEGNGDSEEDEEDEEDVRSRRDEERKARADEERKRKEEEEERKREEERKAREEERKREDDKRRKKEEEEARKKRDDDERRARREEEDRGGTFRGQKSRGGDEDEDEDEGDRRKKKKDDERKKRVADDEDEDGGRARKRLDDEDEENESDDDRPRKKRKKLKRHVLTHAALWADAGASFHRRTLRWASNDGMMAPPPVGTASPAGRLAGEVYPAAFSTLEGAAAGIGISGVYSRTFGLGIKVPGTQITTPVTMGHYAIGARYRFVIGQSSVSLGVSYWRRYFMADRSQLMDANQLDMPDVDYSAIAPGASARIAATPKIAGFATFAVPLMLNSGPIQKPDSYGSAKILAFDLVAGAQIMVASRAALQIALEYDQIGLAFTGQAGSKASTRMVSAATDRTIGLSATLGITY